MPKRVEAFPALHRAGGDACRRAYHHITMQAPGNALAMIAAGRRSFLLNGVVTDHPHRFTTIIELMLRDPRIRAEFRELLDSYEEA